jgi:tyrosyl-tRNA synthetase
VEKSVPDEIEEYKLNAQNGETTIVTLLTTTQLASSKSDARRLIEQGGVSIDGEKILDFNSVLPNKSQFILKVGKRKFLRIIRQ